MTKAQAFDWLAAHPEARPRKAGNTHPPQWRVFGQHHIVYWGHTLLEAVEEAEKARKRNPGHRRDNRDVEKFLRKFAKAQMRTAKSRLRLS